MCSSVCAMNASEAPSGYSGDERDERRGNESEKANAVYDRVNHPAGERRLLSHHWLRSARGCSLSPSALFDDCVNMQLIYNLLINIRVL